MVYQPQLNNPFVEAHLNESGVTQSNVTQSNALLATDGQMQVASALVASSAFTETSNGYLGRTSDGATDLIQHYQLTAHYSSAPNGTVVQTGRLPLTGLPGSRHLTLALGFAASESAALDTANASLGAGFGQLSQEYADGLGPIPELVERCSSEPFYHETTASYTPFLRWCLPPARTKHTGVGSSPPRRCRGRGEPGESN